MARRPILLSVIVLFFCVLFLGGFFLILFSLSQSKHTVSFFNRGDIAILEIVGPIYDSKETLKQIEEFKDDKRIKAIVVRIDTPGGAVAPSQEIYEELSKLKKEKVIVASIGAVGASGGYYIACGAHLILANPGSITGSIGVIMDGFGFQELAKQFKIENRVIKTGDYKDIGNPFREMTDKESDYLRQILLNMYAQFKGVVANERKISIENVENLAQGKVYTGEQAVENHLIDKLGTIYDAIEEAKKLARLPDDATVIWPKEAGSPLDSFFGSLTRVLLKNLEVGVDSHTGFGYTKPMFLWH